MQWTGEQNIHIQTVLHLNKGDDNARGHIGTELNTKPKACYLLPEIMLTLIEALYSRGLTHNVARRANLRSLFHQHSLF